MGAASSNLTQALLTIAAALGVLAVIVLLVVWRSRVSGRRGTLAIDTAYTVASACVFLSGLAVAFIVFRFFFAPDPHVVIPLATTWPTALPCTTTGEVPESGLYCAYFNTADAQVMGAAFWPRAAVSGAQILGVIAAAVPAVSITAMTSPKLRDSPFQPAIVRTLSWGALVLFVTGMLGEVVGQIGATLIAQEVLSGDILAPEIFSLSVPMWPAGAAIAMLALAAIFRHGAGLQQEKARLQRETEGLV